MTAAGQLLDTIAGLLLLAAAVLAFGGWVLGWGTLQLALICLIVAVVLAVGSRLFRQS